jgi:hypothetical protein
MPSSPVACGTREEHVDNCHLTIIKLFDEAGARMGGDVRGIEELALRLPVGGADLPSPSPFGFFELDHFHQPGCFILPVGTFPRQAWVVPVMKAEGRHSVGLTATRIPVAP